jgi:hypothetical protein
MTAYNCGRLHDEPGSYLDVVTAQLTEMMPVARSNSPRRRDPRPPETRKFGHSFGLNKALEAAFRTRGAGAKFELRRRMGTIDGTVCAGITG